MSAGGPFHGHGVRACRARHGGAIERAMKASRDGRTVACAYRTV